MTLFAGIPVEKIRKSAELREAFLELKKAFEPGRIEK